jgi:hypothetical protein
MNDEDRFNPPGALFVMRRLVQAGKSDALSVQSQLESAMNKGTLF